MDGLMPSQVIEKLVAEKSIDWNSTLDTFKWGSVIKRAKYTEEVIAPISQEKMAVTKTVYMRAAIDFSGIEEDDMIKLLVCKFSNEVPSLHPVFQLLQPKE